MYSREEAQRLKQEFWIAFAQKYPRKWLLYDTKIKDVSLKFAADNKKAEVMIAMEHRDEEKRHAYFDKFVSLATILREEYVPEAVFERDYYLESGKPISKIWVSMERVSIHRHADWDRIFDFFNSTMHEMEMFFYEYEDYIRALDLNA